MTLMKKGRFLQSSLLVGINAMLLAELIAFSQSADFPAAGFSPKAFNALGDQTCIPASQHTNSSPAALTAGHIAFSSRSNLIGREMTISLNTIYGTPGYRDI